MDYKNNFSKQLALLRKKYNMSLQSLGDEIGLSNQAVSLLEKGLRAPSFDVLMKLADYFNVSVDFLVGRSNDSNRY